ncbi:MAG: hypothetical protein AAB794_04440 [Patescibacteria group bacterium]
MIKMQWDSSVFAVSFTGMSMKRPLLLVEGRAYLALTLACADCGICRTRVEAARAHNHSLGDLIEVDWGNPGFGFVQIDRPRKGETWKDAVESQVGFKVEAMHGPRLWLNYPDPEPANHIWGCPEEVWGGYKAAR